MRGFTTFVTENHVSAQPMTQQEWDAYNDAILKTKRSKEFERLMWLMGREAELHTDRDTFNSIISGKTASSVSKEAIRDISRIIGKIGDEAKLLPQMLTAAQRESIISGRVDANDYTLDLETQKGRNTVAKRYARLIEKMVNQFLNKGSILSKEELRSSAYFGLAQAMNEYKNPDELAKLGKSSTMSFTSYVAQRIRHQILTDMTAHGRNVKVSNYFQQKNAEAGLSNFTEISLDNLNKRDDDDRAMSIDRFLELSEEPDDWAGEKKKVWDNFIKALEAKFSLRLCTMLYRIWGVNGYEQEEQKNIAKEYGISSAAVTQNIKRMFDWAKSTPAGRECLSLLESAYVCNKIVDLFEKPQEAIINEFLCDEVYMLFESANRWSSKSTFVSSVNRATDLMSADAAIGIYKYLNGDSDTFNPAYAVEFLASMYPEKHFKKGDIMTLKNEMSELKSITKQHELAGKFK